MYSLFILGSVSFIVCLILTPICRDLFTHWGIFDKPDDVRKLHGREIPRVGGIPLALSFVAALLLALLIPVSAGGIVRHALPFAMRLLPAAGLMFAVGLVDDLIGLTPWQKLAGQVAASLLALWAGIRLDSIAGHAMPWWIAGPGTVIWLVGCANALNLIDGLDGLAAGVGFFATVTALIAALLTNNFRLAIATVPLVGALLGFLRYNFNPATIFLGDSGSLLIGFLLGCYGILWSEKSATILGITAPLMALSIPLLDVGLAIVRRFLKQQPIFAPDRGHIHHKLLARGLTPRRVALILYMACSVSAGLSLLQSVANDQFAGVIIIFFCLCAWIGIQHLGYVEFGTARKMMMGGGFRSVLNARILLANVEQELQLAPDIDACWELIRKTHRKFGFTAVEFMVNGMRHSESGEGAGRDSWSVIIHLDDDYVRLSRADTTTEEPGLAASYVECVRKALLSRVTQARIDLAYAAKV